MSTLYTMVAPCFFGTESTLNFEVKRLGAQNIQVTDGRVAFQGGADVIAAANLNLRTAERVLLLLATYKATTFDELFDGCYNIAWEDLLPANAAFPVKGSSLSSQLSSVPACQSIVKKAIVKRLMHGHKVGTLPEDGALYKVRFALRKDTVEIYLDTSGDGLHKRGYRKNATLAPIKETLAAAIADLGRVRRDSLVQDPFCGSGTLVIEAAQKALNLAPGLRRRFAAEHFDFVPADIWAEQRQKALDEVRKDAAFEGIGYDIDVLHLKRTADFLDKYAERTESGDLKRELIGVYFNYKLELGPGIKPDEYARFWRKLTEPVEFHTVTVPDEAGDYTFKAYFSNVGDELLRKKGAKNYWKGLTVNFIAKEPART